MGHSVVWHDMYRTSPILARPEHLSERLGAIDGEPSCPARTGQMFPPLQRVQLVERMRIDASHSVPAENSHAFDDTVLAFVAKHPRP